MASDRLFSGGFTPFSDVPEEGVLRFWTGLLLLAACAKVGANSGTLVVVDDAGETYRTMYTVKFAGVIYVLNVFEKKSTQGIKTPQREIDLTLERFKLAKAHYEKHYRDDR